jgi:hypothetical protein
MRVAVDEPWGDYVTFRIDFVDTPLSDGADGCNSIRRDPNVSADTTHSGSVDNRPTRMARSYGTRLAKSFACRNDLASCDLLAYASRDIGS